MRIFNPQYFPIYMIGTGVVKQMIIGYEVCPLSAYHQKTIPDKLTSNMANHMNRGKKTAKIPTDQTHQTTGKL